MQQLDENNTGDRENRERKIEKKGACDGESWRSVITDMTENPRKRLFVQRNTPTHKHAYGNERKVITESGIVLCARIY